MATGSRTRPLWLTGREPKRDRLRVATFWRAEYGVLDFDSPSEVDGNSG